MFEIQLRNYRRFSEEHPAILQIEHGFTALVGPNNSGKSSLLRVLFELRGTLQRVADPRMMLAWRNGRQGVTIDGVADASSIASDFNDKPTEIRISPFGDGCAEADEGLALALTFSRGGPNQTTSVTSSVLLQGRPVTEDLRVEGADNAYARLVGDAISPCAGDALAHVMGKVAASYYIPSFRNALPHEAPQRVFDMEVSRGFVSEWKLRKTGPSTSGRRRAIEVEARIKRAFGLEAFAIDVSNDDTQLLLRIDRASYRLQDVGTGMAHWVMLLTKLAIDPPAIALIDEPEAGMHPRLQVELLEALGEQVPVVVFATHSLGLARSVASRIYSVAPDGPASIVRGWHPTRSLAELAGEMGFAALQDIGFEHLLLVEGPTDVLVFREWLRKWSKDARVLVMPLGGSSLINAAGVDHLPELRRITPKLAVIIDSERPSANASLAAHREAFQQGCVRLGIPCTVTERRATENYFTTRAIQVIAPGASELGMFGRLRDAKPGWAKAENWSIAQSMTRDDLYGTDIAAALDAL